MERGFIDCFTLASFKEIGSNTGLKKVIPEKYREIVDRAASILRQKNTPNENIRHLI